MNTRMFLFPRPAVALLPLLLVLVAVALALLMPGLQAQAQESAEPTATPTPERREGYEERLAARIARYEAARDAAREASGQQSSGLISGLATKIKKGESDDFTVEADGLDTDPDYQYSFDLWANSSGITFNEACTFRSEAVSVPAGRESYESDSITLYGCTVGMHNLRVQLYEYSIGEGEDYLLETDRQDVEVTGIPTNQAPTITSGPTSVTYREGGTGSVGSYVASDPDGDTITWSLPNTTFETDRGDFDISSSGVLTFDSSPDYENPDDSNNDNVYKTTVRASDGNDGSDDRDVTVTVPNGAPAFSSGPSSVSYTEGGTSSVATYAASDPGGGTITWSLPNTSFETDRGDFDISSSGVLTFDSSPDYEDPDDSNNDNVYKITVRASDGSLSVSRDVTVTVTDGAPRFSSGPSSVSYAEGGTGSVATYAASDPGGGTITWSLPNTSFETDRGDFDISSRGVLTFDSSPDYEDPDDSNDDNVYKVTVRASHGNLSVSRDVTVTVIDGAPRFTSGPSSVSYAEGGTGSVATYAASEPGGGTITWSLPNTDFETDRGDFDISSRGVLTFDSSPDYENPDDSNTDNVYKITVRATHGSLSASRNVTVTVTDVNEALPTVTINGLASTMKVGGSDSFTVKAANLSTSNSYRLAIGTVSRAVGFPSGTSGSGESEEESPPVVVIGEAGAVGAAADDPCEFGVQGVQVPANSNSHTWSLTLNACLEGNATLTARLYEISDDPGDEDTELDSDAHTVTVEGSTVTINGLAAKMQVGRSDSFTVRAADLLASKTYRLTIGTVSKAVGFPSGTSGSGEGEEESPPVVVIGEAGAAGAVGAAADDPCAFGLQSVQVPANSNSHTWSLTLNACLEGSATLTARLYEVGDDPGDEDTELDSDDHTVTVEIPEVTIAAGPSPITEGEDAVFTLTANPAPTANLTVNIMVVEEGSFLKNRKPTTAIIPTSGSLPLRLATDNDDVDEADGSVKVTVESGTNYEVGDAPSDSATVTVLDNDGKRLDVPSGLTITPLPLRRAMLSWNEVPNAKNDTNLADDYIVQVKKTGTTNWRPPNLREQSGTSAIILLDTIWEEYNNDNPPRVIDSGGMADLMPGGSYEYQVKAVYDSDGMDTSDPYLDSDYSDPIRVIDNPILSGGSANGYSTGGGNTGQVRLQWLEIADANSSTYKVVYRRLGETTRPPAYDHIQRSWLADKDWPYYQQAVSESVPQPEDDVVETTISTVVNGRLYAFQINYATNDGTEVFSARDVYVWPSNKKPSRTEYVGTYPTFGHWKDRNAEYMLCKDTFPSGTGVRQDSTTEDDTRESWEALVTKAFAAWAVPDDLRMDTKLISSTITIQADCDTTPLGLIDALNNNASEIAMVDITPSDYQEYIAEAEIIISIETLLKFAIITTPIQTFNLHYDLVFNTPRIVRLLPTCLIGGSACVISPAYVSLRGPHAATELGGYGTSVDMLIKQTADAGILNKVQVPASIRFNRCIGDYGIYRTILHEAGHALGLSGFNVHELLPPTEFGIYAMAHPVIPDSVMNYNRLVPIFDVDIEPDCSPHPFDLMALGALYQGE